MLGSSATGASLISEETGVVRALPGVLDMSGPALRPEEVDRPVAEDLIGDVDVVRFRVVCLRTFHPGLPMWPHLCRRGWLRLGSSAAGAAIRHQRMRGFANVVGLSAHSRDGRAERSVSRRTDPVIGSDAGQPWRGDVGTGRGRRRSIRCRMSANSATERQHWPAARLRRHHGTQRHRPMPASSPLAQEVQQGPGRPPDRR